MARSLARRSSSSMPIISPAPRTSTTPARLRARLAEHRLERERRPPARAAAQPAEAQRRPASPPRRAHASGDPRASTCGPPRRDPRGPRRHHRPRRATHAEMGSPPPSPLPKQRMSAGAPSSRSTASSRPIDRARSRSRPRSPAHRAGAPPRPTPCRNASGGTTHPPRPRTGSISTAPTSPPAQRLLDRVERRDRRSPRRARIRRERDVRVELLREGRPVARRTPHAASGAYPSP